MTDDERALERRKLAESITSLKLVTVCGRCGHEETYALGAGHRLPAARLRAALTTTLHYATEHPDDLAAVSAVLESMR